MGDDRDISWLSRDFGGECPVRELLDRIGSAWSVLVILHLGVGKKRFSELKRSIEKLAPISQRMLTQTLRTQERDGLIKRTVFPTSPPAVEYELTALGRSLLKPLDALTEWAFANQPAIDGSRRMFDRKNAKEEVKTSSLI